MTTGIPRLVILDLNRKAIDTVEKISRKRADKEVHAWAVKAKKEIADLMMQVANDEMYGEVEETEADKQQTAEEEFYE